MDSQEQPPFSEYPGSSAPIPNPYQPQPPQMGYPYPPQGAGMENPYQQQPAQAGYTPYQPVPGMGYPYQPQAPMMENVGVGKRFLAVFIDTIIIYIVNFIIGFIIGFVGALAVGAHGTNTYVSIANVLGFCIYVGYFIIFEALLKGATLGKMALGIRVVKLDGSPISWKESVIRNLIRLVDGSLIGAICIWVTPRKQRLGDMGAKTVVVRSR